MHWIFPTNHMRPLRETCADRFVSIQDVHIGNETMNTWHENDATLASLHCFISWT